MSTRGFTSAVAIAVTLFVSGAVSAQTRTGRPVPPVTPNSPIDLKVDLSAQTGALTFISKMTVAGMAEVELGKMAATHAASPEVKSFGQMMVADHTQAGNELGRIAGGMNIKPPTQLDQKHRALVDRLSRLHGAEFDREYMNAMVAGHQEVLDMLRVRTGNRMTSNAGDHPATTSGSVTAGADAALSVGTAGAADGAEAVTMWAAKTLPTVEQHLEKAQAIQQQVK